MEPFFIIENPEKTYHIECRLIVYRALLGKHPDFLKPEGDEIDGFYTKYYLLIEDNIISKQLAEIKNRQLNKQYAKLIDSCEKSGDWTNFPFKDKCIVYYK